MCGITGFFGQTNFKSALEQSLELLYHRGPDGSGNVVLNPTPTNFLGLGHSRLRIMDTTSHADQPFLSADQDSVMVFNGEIYNFQALKSMLPDHQWQTQSDSEVVIELLNRFGTAALAHLNGMYAIAWYKTSTAEFVLARDPLGIKPLYLHDDGSNIFFASEVAALGPFGINPKVCKTDFLEFLNFGYVHEPNTGFSNISKVAPGQCITWKDGIQNASHIKAFAGPPDISQDTHVMILNAIQGQKAADVPVGTFFSGGIDSTAITAALKAHGLYVNAIEDRDKNPELMRARALSDELCVKLDVIDLDENLTPDQFCKDVDIIAAKVEEPISDYTFIASQRIARLARESGFVVMLSGMGGDEFFAGYPRYAMLNSLWVYRWVAIGARLGQKIPGVRGILARSKKIERLISYFQEDDFVWAYARVVGYLTKKEIAEFFESDADFQHRIANIEQRLSEIANQAEDQDPLGRGLELDQKGFLAHNLTVTDKSSMQESIEVRVPLLDLSLYTGWVRNMAQRRKFPKVGKGALVSFVNNVFGRQIDFGTKQGFNPPLDRIISQFDQTSLRQMILTPMFKTYLSPAPVDRILNDHFTGKMNNTYKIWQLIFAARWLERWAADGTRKAV